MEASYLFLPKRSAWYIRISLSLRAGTLQTWGGLRWPPFFSVTFQFQGMNESGQQGQGDVEDRQPYQEDCRHQRCLREELGNHRTNPKKYRWDQDGGKVRSHERCGWLRHDDKTTRSLLSGSALKCHPTRLMCSISVSSGIPQDRERFILGTPPHRWLTVGVIASS